MANDLGNTAKALYMLKALLEFIFGGLFGVLIAPFLKEKVRLKYRGEVNQIIVDKCPALHSFASSPWAPSSISQTVLGMLYQVGSPEYQRREVVVAPDGVELLLDFKEAPGTPDDAPLMMILHGIGGNSESRLARLLADACVEQGWRAVVYNRRGHGQSTILPAPLVQPPSRPRRAQSERVSYRVEKAAQTVASGFVDLPRQLTKATRVVRRATQRSFVGEDGRPSHLSALGAFIARTSASASAHMSKQPTQDTNMQDGTASRQQTKRSGVHDVVRKHDQGDGQEAQGPGNEGACEQAESPESRNEKRKGKKQEEMEEGKCMQGCLWGLGGAEHKAQNMSNGSLPAGLHATLPHQRPAASRGSGAHSVQSSEADAAGTLSVRGTGEARTVDSPIGGAHAAQEGHSASVAAGAGGTYSARASEAGLPNNVELPLPPQAPPPPHPSPPLAQNTPAPLQQQQQQQQRQQQQQQQQQQHSLRISLDSPPRPPGSVAVDVSRLRGMDDSSSPSSGHGSEGGGNDSETECESRAAPGGVTGSSMVTIDIKAQAEDAQHASAPPDPCTRSFSLKQVGKVFPAHSNHDDLAVVSAYLAQKYPDAIRLILGFSQGSNLLVHYLGVYASSPPPFAAAICVSNAFHLVQGTKLLKKRPLANAIMAHEIRSLLVKEEAAVRELCAARGINADFERALRCPCIREFDQALLCPAYGFDNVDDYYRHQSSGRVLKDVVTPLLCLNNDDDPFISDKLPDAAAHAALHGPLPNVIAARTKRGGHLGWLQGWRGDSWMTDVMLQYSKAVLELVAQGKLPRVPEPGPAHRVTG